VKYHGLARRDLLPPRFLMRPLLNGGTLGGLMEDPIRFDLWGKVESTAPANAALWLRAQRPTLTEIDARKLIAGARLGASQSLLVESCTWSSVQALLVNLPNWVSAASVVQEGYSPALAPHSCVVHQLHFAGVLGCHVCRNSCDR
jgi:hypothetical protein